MEPLDCGKPGHAIRRETCAECYEDKSRSLETSAALNNVLVQQSHEIIQERDSALLQINELRAKLREVHNGQGYRDGAGPCECQWCAGKKKDEAPAYSFTHSSPMKGDRYLDGTSTCWEYDGKEWVKVPSQLLVPDGSVPPPKDGVPAGEGLRFVNDSITFRKEGVMSFVPPNFLYAKLSGAQVEVEKLLQESKEDFQNAERQLSERDTEIGRLNGLKDVYSTEVFDLQAKLRDANLQVRDLTALLRRAEDALGPDRTASDRRDTLMVLGKALVEKRVESPEPLDKDRCRCAGGEHCRWCGQEPCKCEGRRT